MPSDRPLTDEETDELVSGGILAPISPAVRLIAAERARQQRPEAEGGEGWDEEHDRGHAHSLALAGAIYALPDERSVRHSMGGITVAVDLVKALWPWEQRWWKPGVHRIDGKLVKPDGEEATPAEINAVRVRQLVKAGALIAAAIDDLVRE